MICDEVIVVVVVVEEVVLEKVEWTGILDGGEGDCTGGEDFL